MSWRRATQRRAREILADVGTRLGRQKAPGVVIEATGKTFGSIVLRPRWILQMRHKPLGLLAELTHRCPLGCPYCSNPLALDKRENELDTSSWLRVFREC